MKEENMKGPEKRNPTQEGGKGVSQNGDEGTFQDDNPQQSQKLPVQNTMEIRTPGKQTFYVIVRRELCPDGEFWGKLGKFIRNLSKQKPRKPVSPWKTKSHTSKEAAQV